MLPRALPTPPLVAAVLADDAQKVRELLANGADADERSLTSHTVLMLARSGTVTRLLLEAGADPGLRSSEGDTALHCLAGCLEKGELLIERGGDLYEENGQGASALSRLSLPALRYLLHRQERRGLHSTPRGPALTRALGNSAVERELQSDAAQWRLGERWWASCFDAISLGRESLLRLLLAEGVPLDVSNSSGGSPAVSVVASVRGTLPMLRLLLEARVNPGLRDNTGRSAFDWAVELSRPRMGAMLGGAPPPAQTDAYERSVYQATLGVTGTHAATICPGSALPLSLGETQGRDPMGWTVTYAQACGRGGSPDLRGVLESAGGGWFLPFLEHLAGGGSVLFSDLDAAHRAAKGTSLAVAPFSTSDLDEAC